MLDTQKIINGYKVHPIGIGTWGIGGGMYSSSENDPREIGAIEYSISKGQNHIDTAEMYGDGHSEEVVGKAINNFQREELFIASKVWRNNATSELIPSAVESMLKRINTDYLDLIYIHACWDEGKIKDYLKGLNKVIDKGFARAIGLSNFNLNQLKKALSSTKHPIVALQNHYNLVHQFEIDDELKGFCEKNNIMIVAYTPLEGAFRNNKILKVAKKYGKTPAQIAINWLISQENVITIPKSIDPTHIDENLGSMEFKLKSEDVNLLNNIT